MCDYLLILAGHEDHPLRITRHQAKAHWKRYNIAPMPKGEFVIKSMAARIVPVKECGKEQVK